MPIIRVEILKTIDETEMQKKQQQKKQREKSARGTEAVVKVWELNGFIGH